MMAKVLNILFIFVLISCVQQQATVNDVNQVAKKFDVNDEANYLVYEGSPIAIVDININRTSQQLSEEVTYQCYYDLSVNGIVLDTNECEDLDDLSSDTGKLVFEEDTGVIRWTPDYDTFSSDQLLEFKVVATDGIFDDFEIFTIRLINQNRGPSLPRFETKYVDEGVSTALFDFYNEKTGTDFNEDGVSIIYGCEYEYISNIWFNCATNLDGISFNVLSGSLNWEPNKNDQNQDKLYTFRITATDGTDIDQEKYYVMVKNVNDPVTMTQFNEMDTYSFNDGTYDIIYTYEGTPIETIRFSAKVDLSSAASSSSTYTCYFDNVPDGNVTSISTNSCSNIGVDFDTDLDRFNYDGSVINPEPEYEIKLTRASETAIIVINDLNDIEGIDDDGDDVGFNCYYDTTIDGLVTATDECQEIGGSIDARNGYFNFHHPDVSSDQTYEIKIVARDTNSSDSTTFGLVVRDKIKFQFKEIDFGNNHSCAISSAHEVYCWGDNTYGQIGSGDNIDRAYPFKILTDNSNSIRFRKLKTFADHTCALSFEGDLYCWGRNDNGQLGVGSNDNKSIIQKVNFPSIVNDDLVMDFAVGADHTCLINNKNRVYCWGDNTFGQLGIGGGPSTNKMGTINPSFNIATYKNMFRIEAGANHTCVLMGNGDVFCWGRNNLGQLGIGNNDDQSSPKRISTISNVYSLSLGENHTCFNYNYTGVNLACTGDNQYGQLGDGTTTDSNVPVNLALLVNRYELKAGANHTCSISANTSGAFATADCFGLNASGQLGNNTTTDDDLATASGTSDDHKLFVGANSNCFVTEDSLKCWGENGDNQFFNGDQSDLLVPTVIDTEVIGETINFIEKVDLAQRICFTKTTGEAYCADLGSDINSNLADKINLFPPINDSLFERVIMNIPPGTSTGKGIYVNRERDIHLFGLNDEKFYNDTVSGFLNFFDTPEIISTKMNNYSFASSEHFCFLEGPGLYYHCSGSNDNYELGDNTTDDDFDFHHNGAPGPAVRSLKVVSGKDHSCLLSARFEIYCWGTGPEVGQGVLGVSTTPTLIDTSDYNDLYFIDIFAGDDMTCAISDEFELYCFGDYYSSETIALVPLPNKVYLRDVKIAETHFCGIAYDGDTYCWGDNSSGQLGNGTTTNQTSPLRVSVSTSAASKFVDVSVSNQNTCGVTLLGKMYCWGENGPNMRFTNLVENTDYLVPQLYVPQN